MDLDFWYIWIWIVGRTWQNLACIMYHISYINLLDMHADLKKIIRQVLSFAGV